MQTADDGGGEFATAASAAHSSRDRAFEIFVKRTITGIQKEAWGRSKEVRDIREACQTFLNTLEQSGGCAWMGGSRGASRSMRACVAVRLHRLTAQAMPSCCCRGLFARVPSLPAPDLRVCP